MGKSKKIGKKQKYQVKGKAPLKETKAKKEKSVEDKFYWSRGITGIVIAILGSGLFHLVGYSMLVFMLVFLLAFPFFLSFVVFKLPYEKDKWDWKKIIKTGSAPFFFFFMLISTSIHTINVMPDYQANFDNPADTCDVAVFNNMTYVADGSNGFLTINISNFNQRELIEKFQFESRVIELQIQNDLAVVRLENNLLQVYNITSPGHLVKLDEIQHPGGINRMELENLDLYILTTTGYDFIDLSQPENLAIQNLYKSEFSVLDLYQLDSETQIIIDSEGQVKFYNISGTEFHLISNFTTNGTPKRVLVNGTTAYIADGGIDLSIYDISDITNMTAINHYNVTDSNTKNIGMMGNYIFTISAETGYTFFNSSNFTLTQNFNSLGNGLEYSIDGKYLYLADNSYGLIRLDPTNLVDSPVQKTTSNMAIPFGWNWTYIALITIPFVLRKAKAKIRT